MAGTATLNVRMDEDTKRDFTAFCSELGMSASSLMNVFAKTVIRNQEVPFPMTTRVVNADRYRSIFPQTEAEVFDAIDAGGAIPVEECEPMDAAAARVRERVGW